MKRTFLKDGTKSYYEQLPKDARLQIRNEFLQISGMSIITFYDKLRKDSFKPLERKLFEELLSNR